jgi:lipopolysaccharide assembly LptE-like protein
MILKINGVKNKIQKTKSKKQEQLRWTLDIGYWTLKIITASLLILLFSYSTCKYSFIDSSPIPVEVKTFRVNYITNKASYTNPQLSPLLTEALKEKIISNTRLHQTNEDTAHYDISGYISNYSVTTTGITGNTPSQNRLTVGFHLIFKDKLDDTKSLETDISNNFDFSATQTLSEAESTLTPTIVSNLTDAIFNKIFSNW